jgi:hypothetical protein
MLICRTSYMKARSAIYQKLQLWRLLCAEAVGYQRNKPKLLFNVKIKMPKYELQTHIQKHCRFGNMTCLFYLYLYVVLCC